MSSRDTRLYLCTNCCRRCYWHELSHAEHRCPRCLLPPRPCALCGRKFEPRNTIEAYCKRCEFHFIKEVSYTPPPVLDLELDTDSESEQEPKPVPPPVFDDGLYGETRQHSMAERWDEIRKAAGL